MEAQSIKKLNDKLLLASHLMNERKYQDAKIILLEYIQYVEPLIKKSTKEISFCFSNVAEFYIYTQQNKLKKSVSWVSYKLDIAYQWLAYIANEEGKYKEASNYIEKGLQYNPMNTDLIYEECETYKLQKNWDKLYNATKKVYPIIITARDMAKYYRALGYYFIEKGIFELAYALYMFSLEYEQSNVAEREIDFIRETINNPYFNMSLPDAINVFLKNNINLSAPKENINLLKKLLKEKELIKDNTELEFDIEETIFSLTKDDTYFHSFFVSITRAQEQITEDITLKILNNSELLKEISNKKAKYKVEYVVEDKNNTYKGYTTIDTNNLVIAEKLDDKCPYQIKLYGVFSSNKKEESFIEFKIASKE